MAQREINEIRDVEGFESPKKGGEKKKHFIEPEPSYHEQYNFSRQANIRA